MVINMPVSGELFHTAAGTAFVDLLINGRRGAVSGGAPDSSQWH
jgi:hypothetical protein